MKDILWIVYNKIECKSCRQNIDKEKKIASKTILNIRMIAENSSIFNPRTSIENSLVWKKPYF